MSAAPPLDCTLRSSRTHALVLLSVHVSAVAALLHTRLPGPLAMTLAALLLAGAAAELWRGALRRGPRAVRRVRTDTAGWWLQRADGHVWGPARPVVVRAWPRAVSLVLRDARGARRRLHLVQDALPRDALRRLRARALRDLAGMPR